MLTPEQNTLEELGKQFLQPKDNQYVKNELYYTLLNWILENDTLKTPLFQFISVLPHLKTSESVLDHLKTYFDDTPGNWPHFLALGIHLAKIAPDTVSQAIRKNITAIAHLFITGSTIEEIIHYIEKSRSQSKTFTLDLLGEAVLNEEAAIKYQKTYLDLLDELYACSKNWPFEAQIDEGPEQQDLPKIQLSIKLSSLTENLNLTAWESTKNILKERLYPIFKKAQIMHAAIVIDMEQHALKSMTQAVFTELILDNEFKDYPYFGIVVQAYLKSTDEDIQYYINLSQKRKTPFILRLVKGAYWDYEIKTADTKQSKPPVYTKKYETDAQYEKTARVLLKNHSLFHLGFASHNIRTLAATLAYAESLNLSKRDYEVQMLYGMANAFKENIIEAGYRLREYLTLGEMVTGMAYLVRRLLENSSNESFLKQSLIEKRSLDILLQDPAEKLHQPHIQETIIDKNTFINEPFTSFADENHRKKLYKALENSASDIQKNYPLIINGKHIQTGQLHTHHNPSHPEIILGYIHLSDLKTAYEAINHAQSGFEIWKQTPIKTRITLLEKIGELIKRDRFQLMALQIREVGKTWAEADADIAEAIDFCYYYAREMERLGHPYNTENTLGQISYYGYVSRGVSLVIAPWNFPLAILTGMTMAALVTGHSVIMKPSESGSMTAYHLMKLIQEAGCPPQVVQFLPCDGPTIGQAVIEHPAIANIVFTGSKAVGLKIYAHAAKTSATTTHLKRCLLELGGKNAIIIDEDVDISTVVPIIIHSATSFAGQKCSALSRLIIVGHMYEPLIHALKKRFEALQVKPAENPEAHLGPVINEKAYLRLQDAISKGKNSAEIYAQAPIPQNGYFIPPTLFINPESNSFLLQDELFGPILTIIKVNTLQEAIKIANNTPYALTGGLFSNHPKHIEEIKKHLQVGNLYINRGITGALVQRHPFGGFKLSGGGSKAGGPDYLIHFMDPKTITQAY